MGILCERDKISLLQNQEIKTDSKYCRRQEFGLVGYASIKFGFPSSRCLKDVICETASMMFDLQPAVEFGWPTCAGRAEEVDHDQKFRPPQNNQSE